MNKIYVSESKYYEKWAMFFRDFVAHIDKYDLSKEDIIKELNRMGDISNGNVAVTTAKELINERTT